MRLSVSMEKLVKALAIAVGLLGLSAVSLPAHAFQAQVPSAVVKQTDVTTVQFYRDHGYRGRHRGWNRGHDHGYRGGYNRGPGRAPDAVIVTPNRPGVYRGNGFTVRQY